METFQEQRDFFRKHWDTMKESVEKEGSKGVIGFIEGFDEDLERRVLYVFARQGLAMGEWEGKNFDTYIEVCDAGLNEIRRQMESCTDEEEKKKRLRGLHVISYNLSADLAECWPGDDEPRSPEHFERGLKAAEDCLGWAELSNSPPPVFSMDYWAQGIHQFSLGKFDDAFESWTKSLDSACKANDLETVPDTVDLESPFGVVLGTGYIGLARLAAGDSEAGSLYDVAINAFNAQLEIEEKKGDAEVGIGQLQKVRGKITSH